MSVPLSQQELNELADRLRDEVKEYGWLLHLLEVQQKSILSRSGEKLTTSTEAVDEQHSRVVERRAERDRFVAEIFCLDGQNPPLRTLFDQFPEVRQSQFDALLEEGERILDRIRRRTEQNKRLLIRATRMADETIALLSPRGNSTSPTYTRQGSAPHRHNLSGTTFQTAC